MTDNAPPAFDGAAWQSQLVSAGVSPEAATAEVAKLSGQQQTGPLHAQSQGGVPSFPAAPAGGGLTEAQFEQLIAHLPPEVQAAEREAAGIKPLSPAMQAGAEAGKAAGLPTSETERADLAKSYDMPMLRDEHGNHGPEQIKADSELRGMLASAGFDRGAGSYLLAEQGRHADTVAKMGDAERTLYMRQQQVNLQNIWKQDFEKNAKDVVAFLDMIPNAWTWLDKAGGLSAGAAVQIHNRLVAMRAGFQSRKGK